MIKNPQKEDSSDKDDNWFKIDLKKLTLDKTIQNMFRGWRKKQKNKNRFRIKKFF